MQKFTFRSVRSDSNAYLEKLNWNTENVSIVSRSVLFIWLCFSVEIVLFDLHSQKEAKVGITVKVFINLNMDSVDDLRSVVVQFLTDNSLGTHLFFPKHPLNFMSQFAPDLDLR